MDFDRKAYANMFKAALSADRIKKSEEAFKIKLFLSKAENSLLIAKSVKEIIPTKDQPPKLHWNYWAITVSYYSMLYCAKALVLTKGYEVHDHDAAEVALGYLCIPTQIEKEDLEILNQSHKMFEDEYVKYFEEAKRESHIARYSAIQTYTERRLQEMFENARKFVSKVSLIIEDWK